MSRKHAASSRIRVYPLLAAKVLPYSKAIGAAIGAGFLMWIKVRGGGVDTGEFWQIVGAAAGAGAGIWAVPNKDPRAEHQSESTQPPDGGNFTPAQQAKLREARRRIEARKRRKGIQ